MSALPHASVLIGKKFGSLYVISWNRDSCGRQMLVCACQCGVIKLVRKDNLLNGTGRFIDCNCKRSEFVISGEIASISLYRNGEAISVVVDAIDVPVLSKYKWYINKDGYAFTHAKGDGKRKSIGMHQILLTPPDGYEVDHADRCRVNNRRSNLRIATKSGNAANRVAVPGLSGYRGVYKHGNKWRAVIRYNGINHKLGLYDTREKAAAVYDEEAKKIFGVFAFLNSAELKP